MSYQTVHNTILAQFRSQWATRQPAWSLTSRVGWPTEGEPAHGRTSWLRVAISDLDGHNSALGVLDVAAGLLTVDLFVPLPEEQADQVAVYALDLRNAFRSLDLPPELRPGHLYKRDFGRTPDEFLQSRMVFNYTYDLPAVA